MFGGVVGSLQWVRVGLPAPRAGPEGPCAPGPEGPWGWMLVLYVRIAVGVVFGEVMGSPWWQERGLGLG